MRKALFASLCVVILSLSSLALAQGAGGVEIQPQVGKIAIPLDNIKELLASLKAVEANLTKLSVEIDTLKKEISDLAKSQNNFKTSLAKTQTESFKSLQIKLEELSSAVEKLKEALAFLKDSEVSQTKQITNAIKDLEKAVRGIRLPELNLSPLMKEVDKVYNALNSFKGEFFKQSKEEIQLLGRKIVEKLDQIKKLDSKLDFLSTVMRRAMVLFKNLENLEKETKQFRSQLTTVEREVQSLRKLTEKGLREIRSKQGTLSGLLTVNLILLVLLVFLELERRFRKPPKKPMPSPLEEKEESSEKDIEREKEEETET